MTREAELNAKLDALTCAIERLEKRLEAPPTELLTAKAAAAALSVSTKTISRMVRDGRLKTVNVGADWRVPMSEVRRYSTPKEAASRGHRQRKATQSYDARAEAEAIRAANGGRR